MINKVDLKQWGLSDSIKEEFKNYQENSYLGRVITEGNKIYKVITENSELLGEVQGKFIYEALGTEDFPAVGDWVILDRNNNMNGNAIIKKILPRKSKVSRKIAGNRVDEQIIAANIDYTFICMSLNNDFNIRRLERYLTIVWDSMATPVILLTKSDLCEDLDEKIIKVNEIAIGVDILVSSAVNGEGINEIKKYLKEGVTCTFIGSSGVGKSSIINYIKGENVMNVNELRDDDKGRHTTTHRQLIFIPKGGLIIDTPGMREIQIMDVNESLDRTFSDIEELARNCKFSDCQHNTEPGCAIKEALENGTLDNKRWKNYLKMKKEIEFYKRKTDKDAAKEYSVKFKKRSVERRKGEKILKNKRN